MNFEHILQASGNLTRKKIGVSLKATKTQIMSIFSDHIFIEIALVVSHGDRLGNKDCHQQYFVTYSFAGCII